MQSRGRTAAALVALALAAAVRGGAALVASSSTSAARAQAAAWLRTHRAWQPDELAELRGVNPEAYAIVKALLTKRALGLLDPKHPSASFANAPRAAALDDASSGPAVFAKIAAESGEQPKAAPLYPDAPSASAHHNWLSWKPQQSALDDESLVRNVLGQVASLKSGSAASAAGVSGAEQQQQPQQHQQQQQQQETPALQWVPPTAASDEPSAANVAAALAVATAGGGSKPAASMSQENSYLKGIDFGLGSQSARPRPTSQENSYLKSFDLSPPEGTPKEVGLSAVNKQDSHSYLAGFSWDEGASREAVRQQEDPAASPAPAPAGDGPEGTGPKDKGPEGKGKFPKGAFFSWLNGDRPQHTQATAQKQLEKPQNSYLSDLQ